jgi:hypothetical protein
LIITEKTLNLIDKLPITKKYSFVHMNPSTHIQLWENRHNKKIYEMFKMLYGNTCDKSKKDKSLDLIACFDRGSIVRPSCQNNQWKKKENTHHFDIDPFIYTGIKKTNEMNFFDSNNVISLLDEGNGGKYDGYHKLSGIIALSDTDENSGGFECLVDSELCFHKKGIYEWCKSENIDNKLSCGRFVRDENLIKKMKKIYMKKGSLLIFARELPHNVYANLSNEPRYAQYVRIIPKSELHYDDKNLMKRKQFIEKYVPKELVLNEAGKQLFMID